MTKPIIHDHGRGPEIEGTRITVYDVMDYYLDGWPAGRIANWLSQRTSDIQAAIDYIEAHRSEVDEEYRKIVERAERGNPPEVLALIEASRPLVEAKKAEILKRVRFCNSIADARAHSQEGHCIAVDLGIIRRDGDLQPRMLLAGMPSIESFRESYEEDVDAESQARLDAKKQAKKVTRRR